MKLLRGFLLVALVNLFAAGCQHSVPNPNELIGTWKVDLRPTPDAAEYYQELAVTQVDGNTFEGTFYGTTIENGRLNKDWGELHFAFVTRDGSGPYNTAGVMEGGRLMGTTNSLGRGFLAVWTAERTP